MADTRGIGRVQPHYLRHNALSRVPKAVVSVTVAQQPGGGGAGVWRFGLGKSSVAKTATSTDRAESSYRWESSNDMWADVVGLATRYGRAIVVSLDMAADIRLSKGIPYLDSHGWRMERLVVRDDAFSGQFRLGNSRITLMDLKAWLPGAMSTVGRLTARSVRNYLDPKAPYEVWLSEATTRLDATHEAMIDLVGFIRDDDLGNWHATGAGQAWANWRHNHYEHKVLAHGRPDLMELERIAAGTGRAEAWRWGALSDGPYYEWDLPHAYPDIARTLEVPIIYSGTMEGASLRLMTHPPAGRRFLLEATVTQPEPVLGHNDGSGWVWPTGTISGVWWDHELKQAVDVGATVKVSACHMYLANVALKSWADWTYEYMGGRTPGTSPARVMAVKHQGRALIGRFGVRYDKWELDGAAQKPGYYTSWLHNMETGETLPMLVLGNKQYLAHEKEWGRDAVPQIMSAIMAEARVRLWELMRSVEEKNLVYVDTDSLIVNEAGNAILRDLVGYGEGWGLRLKRTHKALDIFGPRALLSAAGNKLAGIPKTAIQVSATEWVGTLTEGIAGALSEGRADRIVVTKAGWQVNQVDKRRRHIDGGKTAAYDCIGAN